jgi:hypothetical protein
MEEAFSFFWLVWFTRLELGGSNGGTGFCTSMIYLPLSGSTQSLNLASDSEAFTLATSDCFER